MNISYDDSLRIIGGLSRPEKMPWYAWSISAKACAVGGRLQQVKGSICETCYALKGRYLFPNVQEAHQRRMDAWQDERFVDAFVIALTNLHRRTRKTRAGGKTENRFRWFDSGDLQSLEMLEKINEIALATPQIDHWLPTRELNIVRAFLQKHGQFASNLVVRISVPMVGVAPKRQPFGLTYATVEAQGDDSVHDCPARALQGNRCLDCDACWQQRNVNYPVH